jgi:hypothetical protein
LDALEEKVRKVHAAGARTVIMPAVHMNDTDDFYPDTKKFAETIIGLKKKYPNTIITTDGFLKNINKPHGCSSSSIIIDSDGTLYYPCHISETKSADMTKIPLMKYLKTQEAKQLRNKMDTCTKCCGWYQYFATDSWLNIPGFIESIKPYLTSKKQ